MSVRGRGLLPRALAAIVVAIAATIASMHIYLGQPEPSEPAIQLSAGTPSADQYSELPDTARPAPASVILRAQLERTATVERYLIAAGLSRPQAREWAARFRRLSGTYLLRKGHWLSVYKDPETGALRGIKYDLNDRQQISERTLGADVLRAHRQPIDYVTRSVSVAFEILRNFRQAALHNHVPAPIVETLEHALSARRNVGRLPRGSAVKLIYTEEVSGDGSYRLPGHVEAAEVEANGRDTMLFGLAGRNGVVHLYDARGAALGPQFLRYPVHFRYISSGFTYHRWHPILHCYRPHVGVDLAATPGTPVKSIADGKVLTAGWCGELGNCVRIQHRNDIISIYGHLSRLSPAARVGRYVGMGEVIGYVGSTGLSTGPHLHFGMEKSGRYVNPLTQTLGVNHQVSPRMKAFFDRLKRRYETALAKLPDLAHPFASHEERVARTQASPRRSSHNYRVSLRVRRWRRYHHRLHAFRRHHRTTHAVHTVENHIRSVRAM